MSFLSKAFGLPQKIYEPYGWISNVDKIKWTPMEMGNFPVGGMISGILDNMLGVPYPVFTHAHLWLVVCIWTIGARPLEPKVLV